MRIDSERRMYVRPCGAPPAKPEPDQGYADVRTDPASALAELEQQVRHRLHLKCTQHKLHSRGPDAQALIQRNMQIRPETCQHKFSSLWTQGRT